LRFGHGAVEILDLDRCIPAVMHQIRVSFAEVLEAADCVQLVGPP
jgi:hypothetical protein